MSTAKFCLILATIFFAPSNPPQINFVLGCVWLGVAIVAFRWEK